MMNNRLHTLSMELKQILGDGHVCSLGSVTCRGFSDAMTCQRNRICLTSSRGDTETDRFLRVFYKDKYHALISDMYRDWAVKYFIRLGLQTYFPEITSSDHPFFLYHTAFRYFLAALFPDDFRDLLITSRRVFTQYMNGMYE